MARSTEALEARHAEVEGRRRYVEAVLASTNGNRAEAARRMKIGRNTLLRKLKEFGLDQGEAEVADDGDTLEEGRRTVRFLVKQKAAFAALDRLAASKPASAT